MRKILMLVFALILLVSLGEHVRAADVHFYLYGSCRCPHCAAMERMISKEFGKESLTVFEVDPNCDYYKKENLERFLKISNILGTGGGVPLIGVTIDGELKLVIYGEVSKDVLHVLLNSTAPKKLLFFNGQLYETTDEEIIKNLQSLFAGEKAQITPTKPMETPSTSVASLIIPIILTSIADAINPCAFALLIMFLSVVMVASDRRVLKTGLAFTSAVFMTYFGIGIGLVKIQTQFLWIRNIVMALGLAIGIYKVLSYFKTIEIKVVPSKLKQTGNRVMEKMLSPLGGFLGGIVISLTLLPCTSGPYFVATALISKGTNVLGGVFLLMLYNAIFVSPFLLITLAFHHGQKSDRWAEAIGRFEQIQRKEKLLNLLVGLLLIAIVLYAYIIM